MKKRIGLKQRRRGESEFWSTADDTSQDRAPDNDHSAPASPESVPARDAVSHWVAECSRHWLSLASSLSLPPISYLVYPQLHTSSSQIESDPVRSDHQMCNSCTCLQIPAHTQELPGARCTDLRNDLRSDDHPVS